MHVLDTDYETYVFMCLENAAPAKQSLACQYLGAPSAFPAPGGGGPRAPWGRGSMTVRDSHGGGGRGAYSGRGWTGRRALGWLSNLASGRR